MGAVRAEGEAGAGKLLLFLGDWFLARGVWRASLASSGPRPSNLRAVPWTTPAESSGPAVHVNVREGEALTAEEARQCARLLTASAEVEMSGAEVVAAGAVVASAAPYSGSEAR